MTKAEIDKAEADALASKPVRLKPRDAATLILIKPDGAENRVLMGRRRRDLAFMPGKFVFPGGRRDPSDARVPLAQGLPDGDIAKLLAGMGSRASVSRARALAMSAVRETYEEAGLLIGIAGAFSTSDPDWQGFVANGVVPDLSRLRYVARATTPPGRVRRFDTRFFAAFDDSVAVRLDEGPAGELEELCWLTFADAAQADIPMITRTILDDLRKRLETDPLLSAHDIAIPSYSMRGKRFIRELV